jgi:hypothetical protein
VAAPGFFNNASRGPNTLWGEKNVDDIVIYVWDSMDDTDRENSLQDIQKAKTVSSGKNAMTHGAEDSSRQDSPKFP